MTGTGEKWRRPGTQSKTGRVGTKEQTVQIQSTLYAFMKNTLTAFMSPLWAALWRGVSVGILVDAGRGF